MRVATIIPLGVALCPQSALRVHVENTEQRPKARTDSIRHSYGELKQAWILKVGYE